MTATAHADTTLGAARIAFDGTELTATTGRLTRTWRWTGSGFLTTALSTPGGGSWSTPDSAFDADWLLPVVEGVNPDATLTSAGTRVSNDEGFTGEHVAFEAEMEYPSAHLAVRFTVWAFPDAPGLRVQLAARTLPGFTFEANLSRQETSEESLRLTRLADGCQRQDTVPLTFRLPYIGRDTNVGFYSRKREINPESSFSVLG